MEAGRHEGSDFAEWFAANGITAILLKYRLPNRHHEIPLKDTQEAIRIIRKNAEEWGIHPQKIGIAGFSAGGHVASTLLTHFDEICRPDFGILFYPVISMNNITHTGSRNNLIGNRPDSTLADYYSNEKQVQKDTPPTLLLLSDDDQTVAPENSTLFYNALKTNHIPACMYIFPEGGHGWGFKKSFKYHDEMKKLILDWINRD